MDGASGVRHRLISGATAIAVLAVLYLIGFHNYLLFHSLAEIFSVFIAFSMFVLAWNSRSFIKSGYFLFLGISFFFVGFLDLLHALAYRNVGIFEGDSGVYLTTQSWIAARYMQCAAFLVAPFFLKRRVPVAAVFSLYLIATVFFLLSVFDWKIFATGNGTGPLGFGGTGMYAVGVGFAASLFLLLYNRNEFERNVLHLLAAGILLSIAAELSFTVYPGVESPVTMAGHFFKIVSYYLVYRAVVVVTMVNPYRFLFGGLEQGETMLRKERDMAREYLYVAGAPFLVIGRDQIVQLVNKKVCQILGRPEQEILGRNWFDNFVMEASREKSRAAFLGLIGGDLEPLNPIENAVKTSDGKERLILWQNSPLKDDAGDITAILSSGADITEQRRIEEELRSKENRLVTITSLLGEGVYILDKQGRLTFMNREAERMLGWKEAELKGRSVHDLIHLHKADGSRGVPVDCPVLGTINSGKTYRVEEDVFTSRNGSLLPVALVSTPLVENNEIRGSVAAFHDITHRKRTEAALRRANELLAHQATTDTLTGIHNRLKFNNLLEMEMRKAHRYRVPLSLIMFDIDFFKQINDKYGHHAGDNVLKELVRVVFENIRKVDVFARWGGEEFMVLVPDNSIDSALLLAEKLRKKIEEHHFPNVDRITCSFGCAEFKGDRTIDDFTRMADDAMYRAKQNGRNRVERF